MVDAIERQRTGDVRVRIRGPFERDYPAETPTATARDAAIKHFRLEYEPATTYHLTVDEVRVPELATIGQVAGDAPSVALKLVRS